MLVPWDSHITKLSELIRLAKPSWVGQTVFVDVLLSTSDSCGKFVIYLQRVTWQLPGWLARNNLRLTDIVKKDLKHDHYELERT